MDLSRKCLHPSCCGYPVEIPLSSTGGDTIAQWPIHTWRANFFFDRWRMDHDKSGPMGTVTFCKNTHLSWCLLLYGVYAFEKLESLQSARSVNFFHKSVLVIFELWTNFLKILISFIIFIIFVVFIYLYEK